MFKKLYDKALTWARHKHASKYLCALSFAESSFFPIPPDVMLAPMALATPDKAFRLAFFTTIFSVLGGMLGYAIGFFMFDSISPWLQETHYWDKYLMAENGFKDWGFWAIFIAGFSPIPYKVFTLAAGALQMMFLPFVVASFIGRGARFFLVSLLLAVGGEKLESKLRKYMDILGWIVIVLVVAGSIVYKYVL
ncbi:MAG: DedA family protein [Methylococcales symbiont of Hymedesmia sp. n. MRB-2018]|nr:MAG: DedA family protein [Methylococcales symbiont of Hymedesmia sp. n. MRB-2018]KAF3983186.1 MAG: DedA family protein [Methylococcales symbiont of Hymedesmia sp. n. MRB-2018]